MILATISHEHEPYTCSSTESVVIMEHLARDNINPVLNHPNRSRVQRLLRVQELLLEYSLVIVVLGCFFLVSLPLKSLRLLSATHAEGETVCAL